MAAAAVYPAFDTAPAKSSALEEAPTVMTTSTPSSPKPAAAPERTPQDIQAFIDQYITIVSLKTKKKCDFITFDNEMFKLKDYGLDFTQMTVRDTMPTFVEQATDLPEFAADTSVFTIEHLTLELLNNMGKPLPTPGKTGLELYVLIPPKPSVGGNTTTRREKNVGREFIGLAVDRGTGAYYAYRTNESGSAVDLLTRGAAVREPFTVFFDNATAKKAALEANNERTLEFMVPFGAKVTMKAVFMPSSLFTTLQNESAPKKRKSTASASPPKKSAVKAALDDVIAEPSARDVASQREPEVKMESDEEQASIDDDEALESDEMVQAMKKTTEISAVQLKEVRSSEFTPAPPAASVPADPATAHLRVVALPTPVAIQEARASDRVTLTTLLAHAKFLAQRAEFKKMRPLFIGKKTFQAVLNDVDAVGALYHFARINQAVVPELLGLGFDSIVAQSMPNTPGFNAATTRIVPVVVPIVSKKATSTTPFTPEAVLAHYKNELEKKQLAALPPIIGRSATFGDVFADPVTQAALTNWARCVKELVPQLLSGTTPSGFPKSIPAFSILDLAQ